MKSQEVLGSPWKSQFPSRILLNHIRILGIPRLSVLNPSGKRSLLLPRKFDIKEFTYLAPGVSVGCGISEVGV